VRRVRYSGAAEGDLNSIAEYTLGRWGEAQADRYLAALEGACERLGGAPELGRACDWLSSGLRRMEEGSHVIFFVLETKGILVVRILHKSMSPELRTF
jgi:toxin ParE1/3/4